MPGTRRPRRPIRRTSRTGLTLVHASIAREWGVTPRAEEALAYGRSVKDWPAFVDSASALQYLKKFYKLVILSNVDRESFKASQARLQVEFDYVFTAQDIGSYKPDLRNFEYMITELAKDGIQKHEILHTAESLFHDHLPANKVGLASAWIHRRAGKKGTGATHPPEHMPNYDFRFNSMAELAALGVELLSTGGTSKHLKDGGLKVTEALPWDALQPGERTRMVILSRCFTP